MDWDLDKVKFWNKNEFDWLKMIFSWKKAYAIIFDKWFKARQVTIFPPDFPRYQIMDWDLDKGEILKTFKNEFDWLKMIFSWKKAYAIIFAKFQLISSHFDKLPYFTPDFPRYQIMDWDLDKGEILKTSKNEFDWLKMIFFMKEGIRDHNRITILPKCLGEETNMTFLKKKLYFSYFIWKRSFKDSSLLTITMHQQNLLHAE